MLGQDIAQHIAQPAEHGQEPLTALAALGVGSEQQTNAGCIVMQCLTAFQIFRQHAEPEEE